MHRSQADEWVYYVAEIGHELRTPLNIIKGFAELLDREVVGDLNPKQRIYTKKIMKESDALLETINQLLDWARISSNQLDLTVLPTDLYLLGLEIQGQFELRVQDTEVQLVNEIPRGTQVKLDPNKFRQVLVNIVDNAFKFTPPGGVITLSVRDSAEGLYLDIQDTGVGMNPDQLLHIFKAFDTASENVEKEGHGAGLGLWIAKSIVEAHGGQLTATSTLGQGSTFSIYLPKEAEIS